MPANKNAFDLMGDHFVEISTDNESLIEKIVSYDEKSCKQSKANFRNSLLMREVQTSICQKMENKCKNNINWHVNVTMKYGEMSFMILSLQTIGLKIKTLPVQNSKWTILKRKIKKITIKFEPSNDEDVVIKAYLDTETSKVESHMSYIEKEQKQFSDLERSIKEVLIEGAVKETIEKLYDKGLFSWFDNAAKVLKSYLHFENLKKHVDLI